jgi:hypothetical protein
MEKEEKKGNKKFFYSKTLLIFLFFVIILLNLNYINSQANIVLSIDVEPEYSIVSAGDPVIMQINLIQLGGGQEKKDIIVSLCLVDSEGKASLFSTETISLETRASLVSRLDIPENANNGIYKINVEIFDINEKNMLGKASKEIIIEKTRITRGDIYLIGFCLSIIILFILIIVLYRQNKFYHSKTKITKSDIKNYLED